MEKQIALFPQLNTDQFIKSIHEVFIWKVMLTENSVKIPTKSSCHGFDSVMINYHETDSRLLHQLFSGGS